MPLHLIKLAVGCESVKELKSWVAQRMQTAKQKRLAASSYSYHPDDAETRRRIGGGRLALLGHPGRNRGPRKNPRDRAVPRPRRDRAMPAGDAAQSDRCAAAADARVPGLALLRPKATFRRTWVPWAPALRQCPSRCGRELRDLGLL